MPARMQIAEKLYKNVEFSAGCWIWTGDKNHKGYGLLRPNAHSISRTSSAHRVVYEEECGPIPSGMFVCHHCDNPSCVRWDHLFLGTHRDNQNDMVRKGRQGWGKHEKAKTHCPQGHEYTAENTYVGVTSGWRSCKACAKVKEQKRNHTFAKRAL